MRIHGRARAADGRTIAAEAEQLLSTMRDGLEDLKEQRRVTIEIFSERNGHEGGLRGVALYLEQGGTLGWYLMS